MELLVSETAAAAARALAGRITVLARQAMGKRGVCNLGLGLGPDATTLYAALVNTEIFWGRVNVFQVEERVAPDGHPDRRADALVEELSDQVGLPPGRLHLIDVAAADLAGAARRYGAALPDHLDVVVLGSDPGALWPDGDLTALDAAGHDLAVAVVAGPDGEARPVLTPGVLCDAEHRFVLATGDGGRRTIEALRNAEPTQPLGRFGAGAVVYADRTAAG